MPIAFNQSEACAHVLRTQEVAMFEKKSIATRRPEPINVLRQMTSELDRMFDEPWTMFRWPSAAVASPDAPIWAPKVDVVTKNNTLITRVDLPGMKKEDVLVEVEDGFLTLSGERKKETKEEKDNVYREEREYGSFCRSVPLPKGVKADDVKATFANGVLEVSMPLPAAEKPNGRTIPIQDAAPAKTAAA
jgi:HSP20 family protein